MPADPHGSQALLNMPGYLALEPGQWHRHNKEDKGDQYHLRRGDCDGKHRFHQAILSVTGQGYSPALNRRFNWASLKWAGTKTTPGCSEGLRRALPLIA